MAGILVFAVGADAVGSAVHQKGIGTGGGILGYIDRGKQPLPVTHRYAELVLGVVGADVVFLGRVGGRGLGAKQRGGKNKNGQNDE